MKYSVTCLFIYTNSRSNLYLLLYNIFFDPWLYVPVAILIKLEKRQLEGEITIIYCPLWVRRF